MQQLPSTVWVCWIIFKVNIYFPVTCKNAQFAHLFYFLGWLRIWFAQIIRDMLNYISKAMMQEFLDLLVKLSKWPGASSALVNIPKVNIQFVNVAIIWVPKEMDGVSWPFLVLLLLLLLRIITNYYYYYYYESLQCYKRIQSDVFMASGCTRRTIFVQLSSCFPWRVFAEFSSLTCLHALSNSNDLASMPFW